MPKRKHSFFREFSLPSVYLLINQDHIGCKPVLVGCKLPPQVSKIGFSSRFLPPLISPTAYKLLYQTVVLLEVSLQLDIPVCAYPFSKISQ